MPDLAQLTDSYVPTAFPVQPLVPTKEDAITIRPVADAPSVEARPEPMPDVGNGVLEQPFSAGTKIGNRLTGSGGEERYQTWPERMIREGLAAPGDVLARPEPMTSDQMIEPAMATAALAGTGGLAGGVGEGVALGSTPMLRPALKYGDKIYKAPANGQHLDAIPAHLADEFQKQALSGEDISNYNFGFVNHKGQFLDREKALDYAIKEGIVDPSAAQFGALTSTLMSDSSKPGVAIEAMRKVQPAKENLKTVIDSNFKFGKLVGDKTVDIGKLKGGVTKAADDLKRVDTLAEKMKSPDGYIERLIVDQDGNVLEGQHRLDALRKNGATKVPVTVVKDLESGVDTAKMRDAIKAAGVTRSDQINQLVRHVLELNHSEKGNISNISEYEIPGYEKPFRAAVNTLKSDNEAGAAIQAIKPTFYSALEHNVNNISQGKMTGDQWLGTLSNKPGVKPEEMQWTGLHDFLKENAGRAVTKEQVQEHLANNKVELKEVNKGGEKPQHKAVYNEEFKDWNIVDKDGKVIDSGYNDQRAADREILRLAGHQQSIRADADLNDGTKYHSYQLPGGENYREMLMTLPPNKNTLQQFKVINEHGHVDSTWTDRAKAENWANKKGYSVREDKPVTLDGGYKSSHWDEPNILAHVRMNDRTIDGKKSLHLEEIQSDWHQQGRDKGYAGKEPNFSVRDADGVVRQFKTRAEAEAVPNRAGNIIQMDRVTGVPDAPFKKTWHELALKRMIREAAEKGYDRLSWTPGEAQAARYDLSKQIDRVQYHSDKQRLVAFDKNHNLKMDETIAPEKVADYVGKEAADKLLKTEPNNLGIHSLEGANLKIGGEGMKGFYDQIIPKSLSKITGEKVKQANLKTSKEYKGSVPEGMGTNEDWDKMFPDAGHQVHYIDLPQSLKDVVLKKGQPLFSAGLPYQFVPVSHDPFADKK